MVLCTWRGRRHLGDPSGEDQQSVWVKSEDGFAGGTAERPRGRRRGGEERARQHAASPSRTFLQDSQQLYWAEATPALLPPSPLVNGPEGKASGRGTAGASRPADAGDAGARALVKATDGAASERGEGALRSVRLGAGSAVGTRLPCGSQRPGAATSKMGPGLGSWTTAESVSGCGEALGP